MLQFFDGGNASAASRGSRAEMEKHFAELPEHVKLELQKGKLRYADTIIYSIKPITSRTVKMFETHDDKEVGFRNISNAKLPKNHCLLVSGIYMLAAGFYPGGNLTAKEEILRANFTSIEYFGVLQSGEFNLKANQKCIVPETPNLVFITSTFHGVPVGYYKLANPRLIQDEVLIEFVVELGALIGLVPNAHLFVGLHGTITTP